MKIIADTHCHTVASSHAYSTIMENVAIAKKRNLYALGVTDHAVSMPSPPGTWYFQNLHAVPKEIDGIKILRGVEANILNSKGELDLPRITDDFFDLTWIIASIHDVCFFDNNNIETCTETWLNICKNPVINVIGHSGTPEYKYNYEEVIPEFGRTGKLVEINNSSFRIRQKSYENCKQIALLCKKYEVPVILNSDAHFCTQIGNFTESLKLLEEINFPEELVINSDINKFDKYLTEYTNYYKLKI